MSDLPAPTPIVSVKPVVLDAPQRGEPLQVRVSAPLSGEGLPVLVFSHGFGWSMDGYAPLTDYWAAHGFVVVQATYLDSRRLALPADDPRTPSIWRQRVADATHVVDQLAAVEAAIPGLSGRVDHRRIAAAGHSWGAQTTSALLGARVLDADGRPGEDLSDGRVRAGVLLAPAGTGGTDLTPLAAERFPFMNPDFTRMTTPALIVAGDRDVSPLLTTRGADWSLDPYTLSPGPKSLLTLFGAEHSLGGIPGYEVAETTDEHPGRVALLQRLTTSYLRTALDPQDPSWPQAAAALARSVDPHGRIDERP
jgi:dienelactone hydrolase